MFFRDFLDSKGPIMVADKEEKKLSATQVAQKILSTGIQLYYFLAVTKHMCSWNMLILLHAIFQLHIAWSGCKPGKK